MPSNIEQTEELENELDQIFGTRGTSLEWQKYQIRALLAKQKESLEKEAVEKAFSSISTEASDYQSLGHSFDYEKAMKSYIAHLSSKEQGPAPKDSTGEK